MYLFNRGIAFSLCTGLLRNHSGQDHQPPENSDQHAQEVDEQGLEVVVAKHLAVLQKGDLLQNAGLHGGQGQPVDEEPQEDVPRQTLAAQSGAAARVPEGDETCQPLQTEEHGGNETQPGVQAVEVVDAALVVVLEGGPDAEDPQRQGQQLQAQVPRLAVLLAPAQGLVDQDGLAGNEEEAPDHERRVQVEDEVLVGGVPGQPAPELDGPGEHQHDGHHSQGVHRVAHRLRPHAVRRHYGHAFLLRLLVLPRCARTRRWPEVPSFHRAPTPSPLVRL